tara:strand:- start:41 stop:145 length:105 start_codon:yes stop_codon:yes gene_type:complete
MGTILKNMSKENPLTGQDNVSSIPERIDNNKGFL